MSAPPSPAEQPAAEQPEWPARVAARRLSARVAGLFVADGDGFVTRPVAELELDLEGILLPGLAGDRHRGHSRAADVRVPWYPRGTRIRNTRQVSILSPDELAQIAGALDVPRVTAEEVGANLLVDGLVHLSHLPRGTRLHFPSGASLAVEDENAPCRFAGASVAKRNPGREGLDLAFVKAARHRRGLVAWVERPGKVLPGEKIDVRIPEQWIY